MVCDALNPERQHLVARVEQDAVKKPLFGVIGKACQAAAEKRDRLLFKVLTIRQNLISQKAATSQRKAQKLNSGLSLCVLNSWREMVLILI